MSTEKVKNINVNIDNTIYILKGANFLKGFRVKSKNIRNITLKKSIPKTQRQRNSPRHSPYYYEKELTHNMTPIYKVLPIVDMNHIPEATYNS